MKPSPASPALDAKGLSKERATITAFVEYGPLRSYDQEKLMDRVLGDSLISTEEVRDSHGLLKGWNITVAAQERAEPFQARVAPWLQVCFGPEISADRLERGDRFLEEALELLQSGGYPRERVAAITAYTFDRPQGEINQEVGGVMVTLAAYCLAFGIDMHAAGETELARIWTKVEQIRAKQAAKPRGSALPVALDTPASSVVDEGMPSYREMFFWPDAKRRLWFISDQLARVGTLNRADICEAFGVSVPQASADISEWQRLHPDAMAYDGSRKCYVPALTKGEPT